MSNQQFRTTDQQLDLGIITTIRPQVEKKLKKPSKLATKYCMGFIAHNFRYKNKELIHPLY